MDACCVHPVLVRTMLQPKHEVVPGRCSKRINSRDLLRRIRNWLLLLKESRDPTGSQCLTRIESEKVLTHFPTEFDRYPPSILGMGAA